MIQCNNKREDNIKSIKNFKRKKTFSSFSFNDEVKSNKELFKENLIKIVDYKDKFEYIRLEKAKIDYKSEGNNLGNVALLFTMVGFCISYSIKVDGIKTSLEKIGTSLKNDKNANENLKEIFKIISDDYISSKLFISFLIILTLFVALVTYKTYRNKQTNKILLTALNELEYDLKNEQLNNVSDNFNEYNIEIKNVDIFKRKAIIKITNKN